MPKEIHARSTDAGVKALRVAMALRGWEKGELATALGVTRRTVCRNFVDDFSSKAMRIRVNEVFGKQIFFEGIG